MQAVGEKLQNEKKHDNSVQVAPATHWCLAGVDNPEAWLTSFEHNATWDSPRGNPDRNDTYGTLQVTVSKVVMGSSTFRRNNNNNKRRTVKRRPSTPGSSRMGRGRAKF